MSKEKRKTEKDAVHDDILNEMEWNEVCPDNILGTDTEYNGKHFMKRDKRR